VAEARAEPPERHPIIMRTTEQESAPRVSTPAEVDARPPDFTLADTRGRSAHLADLVLLGPLVLIFFRGSDSDRCVEQLRDYKKRVAALCEANATIIAISADDREKTTALVERENLPFRVLVDEGGEVVKAWGLRTATGDKTATFIIGKAGTVCFRVIDRDRDVERVPSARVLEWLRVNGGQGQAQG